MRLHDEGPRVAIGGGDRFRADDGDPWLVDHAQALIRTAHGFVADEIPVITWYRPGAGPLREAGAPVGESVWRREGESYIAA